MYSLDLYFLESVIVIVIYFIFKWIQSNRSTQPLDINVSQYLIMFHYLLERVKNIIKEMINTMKLLRIGTQLFHGYNTNA
jgi:hypothetical protein